MYNFYKEIACSDKVIIAKKEKDNKRPSDYKLQRIDHPHPVSASMCYSLYDSNKVEKYYAAVKEYNENIDFLNALPGFISTFIENDLMISKEQALTLWPEEIVDKIFTSKEYLFKTPFGFDNKTESI